MSIRDTILNEIRDGIETTIQPQISPYTSSINEVRRGVYMWHDIMNKPFVGINMDSEDIDEDQLGFNEFRVMNIYLYCFTDTDGLGDYTTVHQLLHDIEYYFKYDYTRKDKCYLGKINMLEGGASAPYAFFDIAIQVKYNNNI